MTKKVALFIENGSEELEFIAPLDIMRRANLEVDLISANNEDFITSSHNIKILADKKIEEVNLLRDNKKIIEFYQTMYNSGKLVAAICAAPIVLSAAGITDDKEVTSYPGFDKEINYKNYNSDKAVVIDKNVITA